MTLKAKAKHKNTGKHQCMNSSAIFTMQIEVA
jgi:hypothetical protein